MRLHFLGLGGGWEGGAEWRHEKKKSEKDGE